jgi:hypothetical protein
MLPHVANFDHAYCIVLEILAGLDRLCFINTSITNWFFLRARGFGSPRALFCPWRT